MCSDKMPVVCGGFRGRRNEPEILVHLNIPGGRGCLHAGGQIKRTGLLNVVSRDGMAFWGRAAVIPLYVRVGPRQRNFLQQDQFYITRMQNHTHTRPWDGLLIKEGRSRGQAKRSSKSKIQARSHVVNISIFCFSFF